MNRLERTKRRRQRWKSKSPRDDAEREYREILAGMEPTPRLDAARAAYLQTPDVLGMRSWLRKVSPEADRWLASAQLAALVDLGARAFETANAPSPPETEVRA